MAGGSLVVPVELDIFEALNASMLIKEGTATNQTTTLYTVPADRSAYWTDIMISVKSLSFDFQLVKIAFTDDSESVTYDWNVQIAPFDTFTMTMPFKLGIRMDEGDTLAIISPDSKVDVYATANILLAAA